MEETHNETCREERLLRLFPELRASGLDVAATSAGSAKALVSFLRLELLSALQEAAAGSRTADSHATLDERIRAFGEECIRAHGYHVRETLKQLDWRPS